MDHLCPGSKLLLPAWRPWLSKGTLICCSLSTFLMAAQQSSINQQNTWVPRGWTVALQESVRACAQDAVCCRGTLGLGSSAEVMWVQELSRHFYEGPQDTSCWWGLEDTEGWTLCLGKGDRAGVGSSSMRGGPESGHESTGQGAGEQSEEFWPAVSTLISLA